MFWIIITIVFGILATIQIDRLYKDVNAHDLSTFGVVCIVITVLSTATVLAQGISGITDYPALTKKLGQVEALQNRVKDIKESIYISMKKMGTLWPAV